MSQELPAMSGSTYSSSAVNMAALALHNQGQQFAGMLNQPSQLSNGDALAALYRREMQNFQISKQETQAMPARRLVQVIIADPNENVPLGDSLLYTGEQKLTDATDQELFFEIDIKTLLDKHNEKRVKLIDKKVKERTEHLEPAKIRDLKMVVVTVASF